MDLLLQTSLHSRLNWWLELCEVLVSYYVSISLLLVSYLTAPIHCKGPGEWCNADISPDPIKEIPCPKMNFVISLLCLCKILDLINHYFLRYEKKNRQTLLLVIVSPNIIISPFIGYGSSLVCGSGHPRCGKRAAWEELTGWDICVYGT